MKKCLKSIFLCCLGAVICWTILILRDRKYLTDNLIRFHVVANSDSEEDQQIKYHVRDVVLASLQTDLQKITDVDAARGYLEENLPKIQILVDQTLENLGFSGDSSVTLGREVFNIRHYDTFSLPAGVYESLRIVIGEGSGKNWWCVSFPALCIPATSSGFAHMATGAGFSESLVQTLSGTPDYKLRFFFLNQLGELENIFFQS